MIFYSFLDDSSDQTQSKVMVSGSFIGLKDDWRELRNRWTAKLCEHGLLYYKSSEQRVLRGQFDEFRSKEKFPAPLGREAADRILSEFEEIIRDTKIRGLAAVIPVAAFDEVSQYPNVKLKMGTNPYVWAMQTVLAKTVAEIKMFPGHHSVIFSHDDGPDFPSLHKAYLDYKKLNPKDAKYMGGFQSLDDKKHPPLQCADIMANLAKRYAMEYNDNPTAVSLDRLNESVLKISIWDKETMLKIIKKQTWHA